MASDVTDGVMTRLTLHCNNLGLPLPPLVFEDDELCLTDGLLAFCHAEGIELHWLFTGELRTPVEAIWQDYVSKLSDESLRRLMAAMEDHARNGGSLQDAARRAGFI